MGKFYHSTTHGAEALAWLGKITISSLARTVVCSSVTDDLPREAKEGAGGT